MTNTQIAQKMDVSLASVKRYKARGLDRLRKKLDPVLFTALLQFLFLTRNIPF
ncbi:MAG: hypothetical protein LUD68_09110 [Rikenellaceae bacterium]|nr:hypothetical protein [Rikenellaceae bacterium]